MATEFGHIDFMFLGPSLPGRWIRYWSLVPLIHHWFLFTDFVKMHILWTCARISDTDTHLIVNC